MYLLNSTKMSCELNELFFLLDRVQSISLQKKIQTIVDLKNVYRQMG